jgi:hypothetical protein
MKKLILMSALVMGGLGIKTADAQLGIHVNLRFGTPVYAPAPVVVNEPVYDDYYYLPEVQAYYSVGENSYYYQDGDNWVSAAYLPGRYRNFDWRTAQRYEIHANRPYMHDDVYRSRFGGNMNRGNVYAQGGFNNRERFDNNRAQHQYDNRKDDNRGGYDRRDDRNQNNYNQNPGRTQGGYNQPSQGQNQGGYNQGQNPGRNQGGNGNSQPAQGQQGGRGNGQQGGNSQPANHNGGQNRGSNVNEHFAANNMGVVQERPALIRPVRN